MVGIEDVALEFIWTIHALERLAERGLTRDGVEQAVRRLDPLREPNDGDADWRVDASSFVVLYDHPAGENMDAIRIITAWPKRRRRNQHLKLVQVEKER